MATEDRPRPDDLTHLDRLAAEPERHHPFQAIRLIEAAYPDACALLLDTFVAGQAGGTGQTFDWSLWPTDATRPLILAGGLTPENVTRAIAMTRPYAVDVSGGVEGRVKGCKDAEKITRFVDAVRMADRTLR